MKTDLAVIGSGAVTAAGIGVKALLHQAPILSTVASIRDPKTTYPVFRVNGQDPALTRWQSKPRLRRVSPISFYLIEAGEQALSGVDPATRKRTGLIVALCAGCLHYSRRFFEAIIKQGKKAASPALFPETVFNSPVSHVAATLGLEGAAYSLVGDEVAWVAALKTASIWLKQGRLDQVLVLGAEEFDPIELDAYRCMGWMKSPKISRFIPAEGAAGILVTRAEKKKGPVISSAHDGFIYRSAQEARHTAQRCLEACNSASPRYISARNNRLHFIEESLIEIKDTIKEKTPYLGEAFTASAAWNTIRALSHLRGNIPKILYPVWGLNHQIGALELSLR